MIIKIDLAFGHFKIVQKLGMYLGPGLRLMLKSPALWLLLRPTYFVDISLELFLCHPVPAKPSIGRRDR